MIQVVYPDKILAVVMQTGTESSEYPISNIRDDHPALPGRTNEATATVRLSVGGGSDTIFVYNSNLASVVITVLDGGFNQVHTTNATLRDGIGCYWELITGRDNDDGSELESRTSLWIPYPHQASSHYIDIEMSTVEPAISVGVIKVGPVAIFPNMRYGVKEGLIDYSTIQKLIRGENVIMGDIVSTFRLSVRMDRRNDFWRFARKIAKVVGARPLAWKLSDVDTSEEWEVYAKFSPLPSGDHYNNRKTNTTYGLEEVV